MKGGMEVGSPDSKICRHCDRTKVLVNGILFCPVDDAPMVDGETVRATWQPKETP